MLTRYAQVTEALSGAIANGDYPVGSVLPNELELAKQFGVSRSTVRAAMKELQALGLVSRKKSAGTRVESARPAAHGANFINSFSTIEAIQQFGEQTDRVIQSTESLVADDDLAARLGCRPGSRWLHIRGMRRPPGGEGQPICLSDVYIADAYAAKLLERLHTHQGILSRLIEEFAGRPVTEVRQEISAQCLTEEQAMALNSEPAALALEIRRQYLFSSNELAEVSLSLHPADRFKYFTRITRQAPGG